LLDILTVNFVAIESDNTSFPYDLLQRIRINLLPSRLL
jgi:hypothetical protein